ncbi:MAG: hypothetical protein ACTSWL_04800, partial [Promethearchaeota archaeon]
MPAKKTTKTKKNALKEIAIKNLKKDGLKQVKSRQLKQTKSNSKQVKPKSEPKTRVINYKCKQCLKTISFHLEEEKLKSKKFPIFLGNIHGYPAHKLIIKVNKDLKVESFEIQENLKKTPISQNASAINQELLGSLGLTKNEIQLYIKCTGKGPVSLGEMAIIGELSIEEVENSINKFIEKDLFKEIQGATKHYQALPPYAALMQQMHQFGNMIQSIKGNTPNDLQLSFELFENKSQGLQNLNDFVSNMKEIKENLTTDLKKQQKEIDESLEKLKDQENITRGIKSLRDQSINLLDEHYISLFNRFEKLKGKISNNLEKLHLGVIVNTVGDMVQNSIDTEMKKIRSESQAQFEAQFRLLLDKTVKEIEHLGKNTSSIEKNISKSFTGVISQFNSVLTSTEKNINTVSGTVHQSFDSLRNTFSDEVVVTLDDILGQIVDQIDLNVSTMQEFWDTSKRVVNFSMKDVWFVRSPEGMKAQINDSISRVKMRALIVAPTLADIDIEPLKKLPAHINLRISCAINQKDPVHQKILKFLDSKPNISYRERDLQNLWGIHKDYEEIILGIVNKQSTKNKSVLEVAGIGSILEEHIKIFIPILEDAWVGAHKNLSPGFKVQPVKTQAKKI